MPSACLSRSPLLSRQSPPPCSPATIARPLSESVVLASVSPPGCATNSRGPSSTSRSEHRPAAPHPTLIPLWTNGDADGGAKLGAGPTKPPADVNDRGDGHGGQEEVPGQGPGAGTKGDDGEVDVEGHLLVRHRRSRELQERLEQAGDALWEASGRWACGAHGSRRRWRGSRARAGAQ
ncbi:hypothetical protein U9M48_043483 [Paspalum notatum var. saurae]|uniref:Uncharacterized protein n=1 Tax=Paspalum notatum var. saurae TaxID=547442 RepID=A0AAQ3UZC3_PASNO